MTPLEQTHIPRQLHSSTSICAHCRRRRRCYRRRPRPQLNSNFWFLRRSFVLPTRNRLAYRSPHPTTIAIIQDSDTRGLLRCARLGYRELIDRLSTMAAVPAISFCVHLRDNNLHARKILQPKIGLGENGHDCGNMATNLRWRCGSAGVSPDPVCKSSTAALSWVRPQIFTSISNFFVASIFCGRNSSSKYIILHCR